MPYFYHGHELFPRVYPSYDLVSYLGGITMRELFDCGEKYVKAWRIARERFNAYFGKLDDIVLPLELSLPHMSYGHLACLGAEIRMTECGQPNAVPPARDIDEAIGILRDRKNIDFSSQPMVTQHHNMWKFLKEVAPQYDKPFTPPGSEGPITSAALFRGQDFFMDILDKPEKALCYLELMTDSIIGYHRAMRKMCGLPEMNPDGGGICDDFASLIPPKMWETFVVPFWNRYYAGLTTGRRGLHCENVSPDQLKYFKLAGITHYDPGHSDRLTPDIIKANLDIPFEWLMLEHLLVWKSDREIEDWVDEIAAAGIIHPRTEIGALTWMEGKIDRIISFYHAFQKYAV